MRSNQSDDPWSGIHLSPIGVILTPFKEPKGTPIQACMAKGAEGRVKVFEEFREGLRDLDGFERIWLLYWFHRASKPRLLVTPFLGDQRRGLFATRAPCRPNPIGLSAVRLLRVEGTLLTVADVDIVDGTPLLDIKPYAPQFDCHRVKKSGWLDKASGRRRLADERFEKGQKESRVQAR